MKKTMISLATASLIVTSAMAADKGIDIDVTGQAVIYYETETNNGSTSRDIFDKEASSANVGVQLNLDADLKNGFTFGSQTTWLGTAGLEKNLVSYVVQNNGNAYGNTNEIMLTKLFIAKKIYNTTVKIGRQELPMSLSPFAYSESWSVFKNTFDAILAINTDIPDTTVVGAYIGAGTDIAELSSKYDLALVSQDGNTVSSIYGTAYMLTVQNKSIPSTTITASYYDLAKIGSNAVGAQIVWVDGKIENKDFPMGLSFGLQGGSIMSDSSDDDDTTAFGAKIDLKPVDALSISAAFSSVDDGTATIRNIAPESATTPLYTQMSKNYLGIGTEGETYLLSATYDTGDYGEITARGTYTSAGKNNFYGDGNDFTDLELLYTIKAGGVKYHAAYMYRTWDDEINSLYDEDQVVRLWARYDF